MAIYKHGNKQRLDCTIKGKRYVRSFESLEEARAWQAKAKARVALGLPADEAADVAKDMTLREAFRGACNVWQRQKDGQGSITNATVVASFLGAQRSVSALTQADYNALVEHLLQTNAPSTVNRKLSALSSMLKVAREAGVKTSLNIKYLKEPEGRCRILSSLEEQSVLADLGRHGETAMAEFVATALDTGARLSELLAVQGSWIRKDATGQWVITFPATHTKSAKSRTVPLTDRAACILLERRMENPSALWPANWTRDRVGYLWSAMRARIGLSHDTEFVFHCCRHTCATRLMEATGDLAMVKDWLGHSDIRTTLIYAKVTVNKLRRGAAALDSLNSVTA